VATSGSLGLSNLAVRGAHFERTVWILPFKSRAESFSVVKTRKVDKKSAFLPCFYPFLPSPSQPHFRPPPPLSPPSFPLQPTSHSNTQQPCVVAAPPFSLSLSFSFSLPCETLFPLYHRDSSSSSNHYFQQLPPLPTAAEVTTLFSSAPTASDRNIDCDSSSTCNSSSSNPGGSTPHRCHRLHHVVLLGRTTLTPGNFPLPLPLPLLFHAVHCVNSRREL